MADNTEIGQQLYSDGDAETRAWFEKQWRIWPERADQALTTNLALHWGGVKAYRIEHHQEPVLSSDFATHVAYLDRSHP